MRRRCPARARSFGGTRSAPPAALQSRPAPPELERRRAGIVRRQEHAIRLARGGEGAEHRCDLRLGRVGPDRAGDDKVKALAEHREVEVVIGGKACLGTLHHLCLEVPDISAAKATLEARPARKDYTRGLDVRTGVNRKRQLNLFDPDGTRVELMEPKTVDGVPTPSSTAPPP